MDHYDAWDVSWALDWEHPELKHSKIIKGVDEKIVRDLGTLDITMNYHHLGVSWETYDKYPSLKEELKVLATGTDRKGKRFIALVEGKNLPVFGSQFHPEWPLFEWSETANVVHTEEAVRGNSIFADFFVRECRKNMHEFEDKELMHEHLAYRWSMNVHYTQEHGDTQTYYWRKCF